jgi:tetratricopeptide (TPR) repeat protein
VRPGFAVTDANVADVGEICRRLDGLPLAIELATARLRTLPVGQIAARLGDRFRLLSGGSRTAMPRHQTLQAIVDWSWDLLDGTEQRLARRLSVFLDGAALDAVEAVCGGDLATLSALVDKSFVTHDGDGRYRMLETIRVYATERLAEAGEAERIRDAHARYLLGLVRAAEPYLRGHEQLVWLDRLHAERDNLAAALRWSIDRGDAPVAVGLAAGSGFFWALRNHHAEAVDWLTQALALPGEVPRADRASALAHYALNLLAVDRHDEARARYDEAAALDDGRHPLIPLFLVMDGMFHADREKVEATLPGVLAHPDPWTRAVGLGVRGRWRLENGDPDGAEQDGKEAVAALRACGDRWALAIVIGISAEASSLRGDHGSAIAALTESVALADQLSIVDDLLIGRYSLVLEWAEVGDFAAARAELDRAASGPTIAEDTRRLVLTVGEADLARLSGEPAAAILPYREALELLPRLSGIPPEIRSLLMLNLARALVATGDADAAAEQADKVRSLPTNRIALASLAEVDAAIALARGAPDRAARLLGCAHAARGAANLGSREVAALVAAAEAALGPERYAAEYAGAMAYSIAEVTQVLRR